MITKERFLEVYSKYKPSKFITFTFEWFRKNKWVLKVLALILVFGLLMTMIGANRIYIAIPSYILAIGVPLIVVLKLIGMLLNNARINRIMRELNISRVMYNACIAKYL